MKYINQLHKRSPAIHSILGFLGQVNHVSRVYIFEDTADHQFCCNTFEWCAEGIQPEIQNLGKLSYQEDLGGCYLDNFDEGGIFFCPDITLLPKIQYEMLAAQGIVAMLQSAIIENGEFKGYIGFDECTQKMEWSEEQKQCLLLTSKIISTFLCKMRREEALRESNYGLQKSLEQLEIEHKQLQESEQRFQLIMKNASISVWDYDVQNKTILQTEFSQREHGFDRCVPNVPESLIACGYVHPDSIEDFRKMYRELADGQLHTEGIFRVRTVDRKGWWYEKVQYSNLLDNDGIPYKAIAIGSDISATKAEEEELRTIIDSVPGGIGIFEIIGNQIHLRYLNNSFFSILGDTREAREKYNGYDFWNAIHPEDLAHVQKAVAGLLKDENSTDFKYRVINGAGEYIWMRAVTNKRIDSQGKTLIYCSFINVDNTTKILLELKKNQALLDISMKNSKISTWEFDVKKHCAILTDTAQAQHSLGKIVENLPESMIENGYVHPDSADNYRQLFSGEFPHNGTLQYDIQVKTPDGSDYWWERYILAPVYNQEGELLTTLGTSVDITEQKRMLEFYQQQVYDLEHLNSTNLIAKARYNLSRNTEEYYHMGTENAIAHKDIENYDTGFAKTAQRFVEESAQNEFLALFNRQKLLKEFDADHTEVSIEYMRKANNGGAIWCMTQGKLYSDPSTGDIMCFIYCYDITEQKTTQVMIDAVVQLDYDYMALLDCRTQDYIVYANRDSGNSNLPPFHTSNYENEVRQFAAKHLVPEDVERNIQDMSIENIRKQLKEHDRFTSYANMTEPNGAICRKMLQFSYLDKNNEQVLITCVDVTEMQRREQQKIDELQAAKDAAEKARLEAEEANRVKTLFFSRMSHDLRTPLNAVIGLTELAKDELSDQKAMREYISSIHSSGKFLLDLVNDGLDLEKITAEKMVLHPAPYTYEEFKSTIRTMIEPLCVPKNISLILGKNATSYTIQIDHMRFEQIFINLLTNAAKFTPSGGKIEFLLQNKQYQNHTLSCDFIVRDNGIGMSEEFQRKMFEPFSQECNEITPQSQGTGLGLSIVKSLVDLMGGTIRVKSEQGKGTEFTVHLDMPTIEISETHNTHSNYCDEANSLAGKNILLVEDHPMNMQISKKLLEKRDMIVTCADNGQKGVTVFAASDVDAFDAIIMDIRMPVMDGLEATRKIRSLCRSDAKTVPIIAMSANTFEEDRQKSIQAGINAHLSKPIDPSVLYTTLKSYIGKNDSF